ncbi:MAG: InlB B-repeat-containing protein, partial [Methanosarcinales archaeon]|nr:InlB B-repeat-containing protein [Methanosarcinales archaeon]
VSDCYVTGDVLGTGSSVGGLVGDFYKGEIKNSLALNEFVKGSTDVGRIYGLKTDGTLSDTCAWINMSDGSGHFKDGETNVTSVKVWRKYPSSGWATSGFGGDWELNTYGDFLLPVHAWTDKNVAADAAHLIPKYSITYDGNGHTSGTVPVDGTAYLDRFAPAAAILSDAGDMEMENLVFNGWNTAADGSGTAYAAGASLLMDSDMTLYAQWKVPSTPGGGSGTGSAAVTGPSGSATVTDPSDSAPVADPVQPGYETPVEPEPIPEIIVILFFMIAFACYLFVTRAEIEKENG